MKRIIDLHLAPPGGWRFIDPDTKYQFNEKYRSFDDLVSHVQAYREQNRLSKLEKIRVIIEDWLCKQPDMERYCKEFEAIKRSRRQYIKGAKAAAKVLTGGDQAFVPIQEAEKRAAVCIRCPYNMLDKEDSRLKRYSNKYIQDIVGERKTSLDAKLFSCEICSCPLRPKVHISQKIVEESLTKEERRKFPMGLWGLDNRPLYCWQLKSVGEPDASI